MARRNGASRQSCSISMCPPLPCVTVPVMTEDVIPSHRLAARLRRTLRNGGRRIRVIVYNTLTKRKERFEPMIAGTVRMFVCGPTVYDLSHLGHAKTYTQFDLIARYLRRRGYRVTYVQNITDIDDKIIGRAAAESVPIRRLAAATREALPRGMMAALHISAVDSYRSRQRPYPRNRHAQVRQLITGGHRLPQLDDGMVLRIWPRSRSTASYRGGSEVRGVEDYALADRRRIVRSAITATSRCGRARKEGEPFWDTPLGPGARLAHRGHRDYRTIFGPQYDLHGGAVDLIFPHHEAEIAQMEAASGACAARRATGCTPGCLQVGTARRCRRALGELPTVRDALEQALTTARAVRCS